MMGYGEAFLYGILLRVMVWWGLEHKKRVKNDYDHS